MVRVPEHPRARTASGYVFEHILVMEERLGRELFPDEKVHHRNGVRNDNSPENLELWVKPQPPGIRIEDAVAWAPPEILRRYEGT
jgi:HNH endonuclease